jgi:hypothetical protein
MKSPFRLTVWNAVFSVQNKRRQWYQYETLTVNTLRSKNAITVHSENVGGCKSLFVMKVLEKCRYFALYFSIYVT